MQSLQQSVVPAVIGALELVKDKLETHDEKVLEREKIWSKEDVIEGQIVEFDSEANGDI